MAAICHIIVIFFAVIFLFRIGSEGTVLNNYPIVIQYVQ